MTHELLALNIYSFIDPSHESPIAMPKYYVQSGTVSLILQAHDAEAAALWTIHRTLGALLPFVDEEETPEAPRDSDYALAAQAGGPPTHAAAQPLQGRLGETTTVSQRGLCGEDGLEFPTLELVQRWAELLLALDRMPETA